MRTVGTRDGPSQPDQRAATHMSEIRALLCHGEGPNRRTVQNAHNCSRECGGLERSRHGRSRGGGQCVHSAEAIEVVEHAAYVLIVQREGEASGRAQPRSNKSNVRGSRCCE